MMVLRSPAGWGTGVLLATYLITRLLNLGLLPMVSDEGTYITWGVRALYSRAVEDWLASLEDGKQPLLAWLMPPFLAWLPDRLVAGRLVSVLCGLVNVGLLFALGRRLLSPAVGWIAAGLYVVAPITLLHDRMALYDSLVTSGALLVLWTTLAWAERPSTRRSITLGLAMGLALLTKLSALFFLALVPLAAVLWRPAARREWWLLAQAYFLAAAVYSVLYVSPIVGNIQ
ncbi:MAG: glycosyltransferase family 39 protein, partial [Chloroflexota bacterium]|nr:glycosyltransferase family 39 protein [Chloroflexota bacterium]